MAEKDIVWLKPIIHLLIHSISEHALRAEHVPGTVQGRPWGTLFLYRPERSWDMFPEKDLWVPEKTLSPALCSLY